MPGIKQAERTMIEKNISTDKRQYPFEKIFMRSTPICFRTALATNYFKYKNTKAVNIRLLCQMTTQSVFWCQVSPASQNG